MVSTPEVVEIDTPLMSPLSPFKQRTIVINDSSHDIVSDNLDKSKHLRHFSTSEQESSTPPTNFTPDSNPNKFEL